MVLHILIASLGFVSIIISILASGLGSLISSPSHKKNIGRVGRVVHLTRLRCSEKMNQDEMDQEVLECARYGEDEDLRTLLNAGANVNHLDYLGSTALHRASANGHVLCLSILKEFNAVYKPNLEGNTPAHWAAQNG